MGSKLYGCMFPGSLCRIRTETNGNAPCSLISLLYLQYASRDKSHGYVQISSDDSIRILIILANNNAEKVDKYPSNVGIVNLLFEGNVTRVSL